MAKIRLSHIFPDKLRCAIKPEDMENEYYKAMLAGKVVNIVGEIEKSKPIKADFKDVISCDTSMTARLPYKEPFEFKPQVGHIFSTNDFPQTKDHSFGFYRRWAIIHYKNTVSPMHKIPRLGEKIAKNELPQVLAWALEGARRLVEKKFILTETKQHNEFMEKWQNTGDSVFNFLNDKDAVCYLEKSCIQKKDLYKIYNAWCRDNAGLHPVGRNKFYERTSLKLQMKQLSSDGARVFDGIGVKDFHYGCILKQYLDPEQHYSYDDFPF